MELQELFAAADQIGNKYQTEEEIQDFRDRLNGMLDELRDDGAFDDLDD